MAYHAARGAPTNVRHATRSLPNSALHSLPCGGWPSSSRALQPHQPPSASMKLVSIIVPLYKSEAFIRETLESVLAQTYPSFEIVVIDDGSPDNSAEVCRNI